MNRSNVLILCGLLVAGCFLGANVFAQTDCTSTTEVCDPLKAGDIGALVNKVTDFVRKIALYALAPLMIVIGGLQIMTAGSKAEQVTNGWKTIKWTLIGVLIIVIASGLVTLVKDILGAS